MAPASAEQLALSASLFTSTIDSWIPASFGPKTNESLQNAEFEKRLREASLSGENDRLGVGHPDIGVYKPKAPSLSVLQKRLGKVDRGQKTKVEERTVPNGKIQEEEDSDEEDSRSRTLSSKKRNKGVQDLLMGKKKKGKTKVGSGNGIHPFANTASGPSTRSTSPVSTSKPGTTDEPTLGQAESSSRIKLGSSTPASGLQTPTVATSSPGGSGSFPFTGPIAIDSPRAQRILDDKPARKRPRDDSADISLASTSTINGRRPMNGDDVLNLRTKEDEEGEEDHAEAGDGAEMSKSQRRREARKRAKLAKQES